MPFKFDFLVIGSGSAGLMAAIKAAEFGTVGIITKKNKSEANTAYAQGGIASVLSSTDSFEKHIQDTLKAGAGLCKKEAVELIVKEGPGVIHDLVKMGARFTTENGEFHLVMEGGHSEKRIVHAADMTGREIEKILVDTATAQPNIEIFEHHFALELLTEHHLGKNVTRYDRIRCFGAYVLDTKTGEVHRALAKTTLLATGGTGQIYQHTTNPDIATGDGIAMAYRAKARISNMEFIQFHPTSLCVPEAGSFLISEAVRGHGGILRNSDGEAFMANYHERKELAPRDIVARSIDDQLKKRGDECVYLDVTHIDSEELISHFPNIYSTCLKYGIDITRDQIPVVPAAHYNCGGVVTDLNGQTSIKGLFSCGETACTGVHGANRLASNSLLEALVFADRAVKKASRHIQEISFKDEIPEWDESNTENPVEWVLISHNKQELQHIMWDYVGIVRSDLRLERAMRRIRLLDEEVEHFYHRTKVSVPLCELRNLIGVAFLIVRSAMMRKESRGLHYTTDYPEPKQTLISDTII
ncbi:MAG: L-aspartate oxidase [Balneolaceae bacterium]